MSEDRRLFDSLARTLGVALENVRFRQQRRNQENREQELRLLASPTSTTGRANRKNAGVRLAEAL